MVCPNKYCWEKNFGWKNLWAKFLFLSVKKLELKITMDSYFGWTKDIHVGSHSTLLCITIQPVPKLWHIPSKHEHSAYVLVRKTHLKTLELIFSSTFEFWGLCLNFEDKKMLKKLNFWSKSYPNPTPFLGQYDSNHVQCGYVLVQYGQLLSLHLLFDHCHIS